MADAKIITYGEAFSATVDVVPDNQAVALKIEGSDAQEYIHLSTLDTGEQLEFFAGGAGVRINDSGHMKCSASGGWIFTSNDPSDTAPNIFPSASDDDTGIGHYGGTSDSDALSLIAGGVEGIRITEDTTILAEIKGRTVITADTSGTPDDLGDFDNYALVLQGSSNTNDETALLLSSSGNTYGGSAIVHKDTGAGGQGELNLYTKQATGAVPPVKVMTLTDAGVCVLQAGSALQYNAGTGTDTATTEPVYLADTNATLIIDFANGNFGDVTLAAAVTAVKFFNVPDDGTCATVTARITQDSSTRTIDYADSAVTVYSDGGSTAITGEIKFSGGVHHTQSTGSGDADLVSFSAFRADGTATAITGATQDDNDPTPCTITSNGHGLANGDRVTIASVVGMTELNGNMYTVVGVTANTFGLTGIDASGYTAYGSGGTFTLHIGNIYAAVIGQDFA